MNTKCVKKLKFLSVSVAIFGAIIPSITMAGMFSWVPGFGVSANGEDIVYNHASLYAGSSLVIAQKTEVVRPVVIHETALMQSSPIVTNLSHVKAVQSKRMTFVATAYSSTPDQTDDSPFITAKGTHVRDGIIATNVLPFNTLIKMPELYGDKVFVVEDRMNSRYNGQNRLDVWFPDRQTAIQFGAKSVAVEVIGSI